MIAGLLLLDKPQDASSFDMVREVKGILKVKKVGHFGTLDPMATGLLLIALDQATKFLDLFQERSKTYRATVELGVCTDTYDMTGTVLRRKSVSVSEGELKEALNRFLGDILQVPPMFSAKKHQGQPLYKLAREGKSIEREPVKVRIESLNLTEFSSSSFSFDVTTSSGTYIRSLANDIGELLGTGAALSALRRIRIGDFHVEHAITLEDLRQSAEEENYLRYILPIESIFPEFPKIILTPRGAVLAANGAKVPLEEVAKVEGVRADYFKLFDDEGRFLCLAKPDIPQRVFRPVVMLQH